MVGPALTRLRWRLRGAWMWPTFIGLTVLDGVMLHSLPPSGDGWPLLSGWFDGLIWNLIGIALLSAPLGWVVRQLRADMPKVVARDYAGTGVCLAITVVALVMGIAHHQTVVSDRQALQEATSDAEAYIGDHAPQQFMGGLRRLDTYELLPPRIYRVCAANPSQTRSYCVVVNLSKPFAKRVSYSGAEPNSLVSEGTS